MKTACLNILVASTVVLFGCSSETRSCDTSALVSQVSMARDVPLATAARPRAKVELCINGSCDSAKLDASGMKSLGFASTTGFGAGIPSQLEIASGTDAAHSRLITHFWLSGDYPTVKPVAVTLRAIANDGSIVAEYPATVKWASTTDGCHTQANPSDI